MRSTAFAASAPTYLRSEHVPRCSGCAQDAAQVHLEIGRRIFRGRLEVGDKSEESAQRKEFQKLVFLSTLVFGEAKARFLLPWKRVFQVRLRARDGRRNQYP